MLKRAATAIIVGAALALTSCSGSSGGSDSSSGASKSASSKGSATDAGSKGDAKGGSKASGGSDASSPAEPTQKPKQIHIVSAGDILPHLSVNAAARRSAGGKLDYTPLFKNVEPYIKNADLAICALEVPVAPPGEAPSNYPAFGSPPEIAGSLKKLGWDGCATATNHSMDRGFPGVKSTLDTLDKAGLGHHGTARTAKEADETQYYTLKVGDRTVKVAHLSATTLTNGIPIPAQQPWSWNVVGKLGHRSVQDVIDDAKAARENGADLVVVNMHWGTEYVSQPIPEQRDIAKQLADSGQVDLVFGNHSHVPEPIAKVNGGPEHHGMWVVWSMGNMVSGQSSVATREPAVTSGLLTTATVDVPAKGPLKVSGLDYLALTQDMNTDHVYSLKALENGYKDPGMTLSPAEIARRGQVTRPVMKGATERTAPPKPDSTYEGQKRE